MLSLPTKLRLAAHTGVRCLYSLPQSKGILLCTINHACPWHACPPHALPRLPAYGSSIWWSELPSQADGRSGRAREQPDHRMGGHLILCLQHAGAQCHTHAIHVAPVRSLGARSRCCAAQQRLRAVVLRRAQLCPLAAFSDKVLPPVAPIRGTVLSPASPSGGHPPWCLRHNVGGRHARRHCLRTRRRPHGSGAHVQPLP